jgi:hypothetical protein
MSYHTPPPVHRQHRQPLPRHLSHSDSSVVLHPKQHHEEYDWMKLTDGMPEDDDDDGRDEIDKLLYS